MFFMIHVLYCIVSNVIYFILISRSRQRKNFHLKSYKPNHYRVWKNLQKVNLLWTKTDANKEMLHIYDSDYEMKWADSCPETQKAKIKCAICGKDITGYLIHVACNMFWQRHQISLYVYAKKTAVLCLALLTEGSRTICIGMYYLLWTCQTLNAFELPS